MIHITKKAAILATSVITLGALGGTAATVQNKPSAGADTSPIVTTLDNHETRIKNAENNIKDLQVKTNTPASTGNQTVPVVNTQTSDTSAATTISTPVTDTPEPVVVTAFREIVLDNDTSDCEYTYSDGTTYQFHWKTTNPQSSWQTDGQGQNGHWAATISKSGTCSDKAVGQLKIN